MGAIKTTCNRNDEPDAELQGRINMKIADLAESMEISEIRRRAREIREILEMASYPVGVKLLPEPTEIKAVRVKGLRYCQALMMARRGDHVVLGKDDIGCAASASVFGFKPLPENYKNGDQAVKIGVAKDKKVGGNIYQEFSLNGIEEVYLFPLETAEIKPDVVIFEDTVESLMWIVLAYVNISNGERVKFSSAVLRATCLDCTAIPYQNECMNFSLGCYGCRMATDIEDGEALVGLHFKYFEQISDYVKFFARKAIPAARSKKVYKAFEERFLKQGRKR